MRKRLGDDNYIRRWNPVFLFSGEDILPTVHLSLPEATYAKLKERAAEMGVQVTDLIKFFIKHGLEKGFTQDNTSNELADAVMRLSKRVDRLERDTRIKVTMMEGKYREIESTLAYIIERLETLEELIADEVNARKLNAYERL